MSDDHPHPAATVRADEFREDIKEFRDAVEHLIEATENLENSAVYVEGPLTDTAIEATELLDVDVSVSVSTGRSPDDVEQATADSLSSALENYNVGR